MHCSECQSSGFGFYQKLSQGVYFRNINLFFRRSNRTDRKLSSHSSCIPKIKSIGFYPLRYYNENIMLYFNIDVGLFFYKKINLFFRRSNRTDRKLSTHCSYIPKIKLMGFNLLRYYSENVMLFLNMDVGLFFLQKNKFVFQAIQPYGS